MVTKLFVFANPLKGKKERSAIGRGSWTRGLLKAFPTLRLGDLVSKRSECLTETFRKRQQPWPVCLSW